MTCYSLWRQSFPNAKGPDKQRRDSLVGNTFPLVSVALKANGQADVVSR